QFLAGHLAHHPARDYPAGPQRGTAVNAMTLDPATYTCPDHNLDLTDLVTEALEDDGPPVAYPRPRLPGRAGPRPPPLKVRVIGPGAAGGGSRELVGAGTRTG